MIKPLNTTFDIPEQNLYVYILVKMQQNRVCLCCTVDEYSLFTPCNDEQQCYSYNATHVVYVENFNKNVTV